MLKRRTEMDPRASRKTYKKVHILLDFSHMTVYYEYTNIGSIEEENEASINFYAVVIDACFPYKVDEKKFIYYLKTVDNTVNVSDTNNEFAIVVLQARKFEDLPTIQRCGDIIKVHRAEYNCKDS